MKGMMFNYLEDFVVERYGLEKWYKLKDMCPLKTKEPFVKPGTYPDSDYIAILSAVTKKMEVPLDSLLLTLGDYIFLRLATDYPIFLEKHTHPKSFLKTVSQIIHLEVKKMYSFATPPDFIFEDPEESRLIMHYHSKRSMCKLIEGMLEGVGTYFNTKILYKQTACKNNGDSHCTFDLKFQ